MNDTAETSTPTTPTTPRPLRSETIAELVTALAKAQGAIRGAKKGEINPAFKSKYADLAAIWDACRVPLSTNGLAVMQTVDMDERSGHWVCVTTLAHTSGEWMESRMPIRPMQDTPQGFGSALTYGRRYGLAAIVGVAPDDDDDGNAGSQRGGGNGNNYERGGGNGSGSGGGRYLDRRQQPAPGYAAADAVASQGRGEPAREYGDTEGDQDAFTEDEHDDSRPASAGPAPANRCTHDGCANVLTAGQMTISNQKFGRPLCILHQREATPKGTLAGTAA